MRPELCQIYDDLERSYQLAQDTDTPAMERAQNLMWSQLELSFHIQPETAEETSTLQENISSLWEATNLNNPRAADLALEWISRTRQAVNLELSRSANDNEKSLLLSRYNSLGILLTHLSSN